VTSDGRSEVTPNGPYRGHQRWTGAKTASGPHPDGVYAAMDTDRR
jgi:hypothetical protein